MQKFMLALGVSCLAASTVVTLAPAARAQPAPATREYKMLSINFGTMAGASAMDKSKLSQEEALNKLAKEGWHLVTTAPMANGTLYLYLER